MPAQTRLFMCLKDNFGVLLHDPDSGRTAAIDAPEAAPVEAALKATGWTLTDILVTHHHRDHTDGIEELKARHRCRVVAPEGEAGAIPAVDETMRDGGTVKVGALEARVIETPGHTSAPATLYFPAEKLVFAGDTLVLDRLRPRDRRHDGADVAVNAEAARAAGRHDGPLRSRIHAGEHPLRQDDRT